MKISDLLRDFADTHLLRGIADAVDEQLAQTDGTPAVTQAEVEPETDGGNVDGPEGVFIPPLQQKIELMKKATGVDNVYDDGQDKDPGETSGGNHSYPKQISQIRKNAGLMGELVDDEPIDN